MDDDLSLGIESNSSSELCQEFKPNIVFRAPTLKLKNKELQLKKGTSLPVDCNVSC